MKNKIIEKTISIILIVIFCISLMPMNLSFAIDAQFLISVGTGEYAITVTTETTVNDIIKVLGQPKLTTPSAFGGHTYTFYTDDNYSNYLYIETTENDEKIISYGSIDSTFKVNGISYGDKYNYYEGSSPLKGIRLNDDGLVKGIIKYNLYAFESGDSTSKIIDLFTNNYLSNPTYYLKGIAEQTITMYNAKNKSNLVFDEDYFYMNEQLKEFGSSIRNYNNNMDKTGQLTSLNLYSNVQILTSSTTGSYLLNPVQWVNGASIKTDFKEQNKGIVDYNVDTGELYMGAMNPQMFAESTKIELTAEEKSKLKLAKEEYQRAMEYFEIDEDDGYTIKPQYSIPESLVGGELKQSQKDGALSYINAIRLGGGIDKLQWNEKAYTVAQYYSTLLAYRSSVLRLQIAHGVPKPEGVTDEFYYKARGFNSQGTLLGDYIFSENCASGSYINVSSHIRGDIKGYIDDANNLYGLNMGHRNNVINPMLTSFGMGVTDITGTQEYSWREGDPNIPIVSAWPANGITFMETIKSKKFYWNAKFYDKYYVTSNTTVKVTCLNTNQVWNFNEESENSNHYMKRYIKETFDINPTPNQIIWKDSTLIPDPENVYKIELSNLKNAKTGNLETYTYRTVFKYAETKNEDKIRPIENISIQVPETIERNEQGVYIIPDNSETKLTAKINENAGDNSIWWTSSNPDVIRVTQNGELIVKQITDKPVTITVYATSDHSVKDTIQVTAYKAIEIPEGYKIKLNHNQYQLNSVNEKVYLFDEYIQANQIKWTTTNPNIATVDSSGNVTAKAGGFAYIKATTEKYGTTECFVYVCMLRTLSDGSKAYPGDLNRDGAINSLDISVVQDWGNKYLTEDEIAVGDLNCDGSVNGIDASMLSDLYNTGSSFTPGTYIPIQNITFNTSNIKLDVGQTYTITATSSPINNTDSPKIVWQTSNKNVATVDSNGRVTAVGGGNAEITAIVDNGNGKSKSCSVTVEGEVIEPSLKLGDINGDGKVNTADFGLLNAHLRKKKLLTGEELERADINGDGKVNTADFGMLNAHLRKKKLLW